jgi:hypothetical protein
MLRLYGNYRSQFYVATRSKWEPWYSDSYNRSHDSLPWIASRAETIRVFLDQFLELGETSIFDVGGDTGDISRQLGAKEVSVVEISNRNTPDEMPMSRAKTKLAILSHVLEHVSSPKQMMLELLSKYGQVYVEVPGGVPKQNWLRRNQIVSLIQILISFQPNIWRKFSKPAAGRITSHLMLRQSEHLTFFTLKGLQLLAKIVDSRVTTRETIIEAPDGTPAHVIQAFFKRG